VLAMNIWIFILMLFVGFYMRQYHLKIQNEYRFDDTERRVLFSQTIALSVLLLTFVLSVGFTLTETHTIDPSIWIWLMCLMLVYIGISSIVNKVSVIRRRMHEPPKGNEAVFWGIILILLAVVLVIKYYQDSYALLPIFG
jgi:putative Mn2+ efflux pump MntP